MANSQATAELKNCKIENPSRLFCPLKQHIGSNTQRVWNPHVTLHARRLHLCIYFDFCFSSGTVSCWFRRWQWRSTRVSSEPCWRSLRREQWTRHSNRLPSSRTVRSSASHSLMTPFRLRAATSRTSTTCSTSHLSRYHQRLRTCMWCRVKLIQECVK